MPRRAVRTYLAVEPLEIAHDHRRVHIGETPDSSCLGGEAAKGLEAMPVAVQARFGAHTLLTPECLGQRSPDGMRQWQSGEVNECGTRLPRRVDVGRLAVSRRSRLADTRR